MAALVLFVVLGIGSFAWRYLRGDTAQSRFYVLLAVYTVSMLGALAADHMVLLWAAWAVANMAMAHMMIHKKTWDAARAGGMLMLRHAAVTLAGLGGALGLLAHHTGQMSIQNALGQMGAVPVSAHIAVAVCLGVAAMAQSALWPFHRWLGSSLNAPLPVSALMHAGLINGGGFLLVRFAPVLTDMPHAMTTLFALGLVSAFCGTVWKLIQPDIKRMLAFSTMGQMGFMIAQCGLGLFAAALAHIVWHGLFKAYLFLSSASVAQDKRLDMAHAPGLGAFCAALVFGAIGVVVFSTLSGIAVGARDTTQFLIVMSFILSAHSALAVLRRVSWRTMMTTAAVVPSCAGLYGASIRFFDAAWLGVGFSAPQPLTIAHFVGFAAVGAAWLGAVFLRGRMADGSNRVLARLYVRLLNASQPDPRTVTPARNHYRFQ